MSALYDERIMLTVCTCPEGAAGFAVVPESFWIFCGGSDGEALGCETYDFADTTAFCLFNGMVLLGFALRALRTGAGLEGVEGLDGPAAGAETGISGIKGCFASGVWLNMHCERLQWLFSGQGTFLKSPRVVNMSAGFKSDPRLHTRDAFGSGSRKPARGRLIKRHSHSVCSVFSLPQPPTASRSPTFFLHSCLLFVCLCSTAKQKSSKKSIMKKADGRKRANTVQKALNGIEYVVLLAVPFARFRQIEHALLGMTLNTIWLGLLRLKRELSTELIHVELTCGRPNSSANSTPTGSQFKHRPDDFYDSKGMWIDIKELRWMRVPCKLSKFLVNHEQC